MNNSCTGQYETRFIMTRSFSLGHFSIHYKTNVFRAQPDIPVIYLLDPACKVFHIAIFSI